ncbi:aldehyde dehydrogenase family 3 member B1 [Lepisosteus oculatus]|uniref:aldehyde dehydrogenase family 3 member B1 n=1 Tax=Lepisosteus oculatus TaxID=7918 RepID=UPI00371D3C4E
MDSHQEVLERLRSSFLSGKTRPEEFRLSQLMALAQLITDNEKAILEALHQDLSKPKFEAVLSELDMVLNEANYTINNFRTWMQPEYVDKNLATKFDDCFIRKEPLGVVLIIGAWNYPLQLILLPLVSAIAAGNCAVLKPSEVSQATEKILADLIPKYLDQDCYAVVCGGAEETKTLLENRFNHIFYTGSQAVARLILQAASVHLTPVTLELGGKSPCLIFGQVDVPAAARRLAWAKFFNAGQSCVAPDYVLCTPQMKDALLPALRKALELFYSPQPQDSQDYGRIVTDRHWTRLTRLLRQSQGKVEIGGGSQQEERYMAPTVVVDVKETDPLMEEEIFGPILPILTIDTLEEGISFVNRREAPLALYVFSDDNKVVNTVLEHTTSGGFCSNDGMVHMSLPSLPFGGIGSSGMGRYHGRWGFETFSHSRGCMLRGWGLERINTLRYPPYTEERLGWLRWATTVKKKSSWGCALM